MLDVGCGWGSFAIHAASSARRPGTRRSRCRRRRCSSRRSGLGAAGVEDLVEIRVADYRELGEREFDAISSIGMVEHVGEERIDLYARTLAELLRPGGRLLNHGIAKLQDFDDEDEGDFSERFVFPDGTPLPLSRVLRALERTGLVATHVEGLQDDYARTTRSGSRGSSRATRRRCGSRAWNARGSGDCTSGPPIRGLRPAGRRSTRCSRTSPESPETWPGARPARRGRQSPRWTRLT